MTKLRDILQKNISPFILKRMGEIIIVVLVVVCYAIHYIIRIIRALYSIYSALKSQPKQQQTEGEPSVIIVQKQVKKKKTTKPPVLYPATTEKKLESPSKHAALSRTLAPQGEGSRFSAVPGTFDAGQIVAPSVEATVKPELESLTGIYEQTANGTSGNHPDRPNVDVLNGIIWAEILGKPKALASVLLLLTAGGIADAQPLPLPDRPVPAKAVQSQPLKTQWAAEVTPAHVLDEYPRPSLTRKDFLVLNGYWDFYLGEQTDKSPQPVKKILVPFPPGSPLSGIRDIPPQHCTYRRKFTLPETYDANNNRVLLHFGAVNWFAVVNVNGKPAGTHKGGYTPFTLDITKLADVEENELTVTVHNPADLGEQPRGKQTFTPAGTQYSASTGIWQTVWLEVVPQNYVSRIKITPDYNTGEIKIEPVVEITNPPAEKLTLYAEVLDGETSVAQCYGGTNGILLLRLDRETRKVWSPESPFLYHVRLTLTAQGKTIDQVGSYFAFRKVEKVKEKTGHCRIWLNGKPLFLMGVIDQGYWSDGFYTAPADSAVRMDIRVAKSMGFNVIRKYQKVENERWYFWCDRLGILVWQDMPAGENSTPAGQKQFQAELTDIIETLSPHPSVMLWTVFNEGAGQHLPSKYLQLVRQLDSTRLVNLASGWIDSKLGDVNVSHKFPGPEKPEDDANRASIIGVYGGLTLVPPPQNCWSQNNTWGYQHVTDSESLLNRYKEMQFTLRKLAAENGLAGAFFHQLTDIETECNGLVSYDRNILKIPAETVEKLNQETIRLGSQ